MQLEAGEILAEKYRIESPLGEGGMGAVYLSTNLVLQKRVALKVMNARFASVPAAVERFLREAVSSSRVSHPSIVQVFDAGQHDGKPWIAMELLEGETVGDRLVRGPMPLNDVLQMADGVLSALGAVHAEGIVHRDLKPDNIFLAKSRQGTWVPKVLDFGVAKDTSGGELSKLTATGAVVGTAHYLSPEQAKGLNDIDKRTDVYAMGVVLFECLSGQTPFEAETITQLIAKMFTEEPRALKQVAPEVPDAVAHVVAACLSVERDRRPQSAEAVLAALQAAANAPAHPMAQTALASTSGAPGLSPPPAVATASGSGPHPMTAASHSAGASNIAAPMMASSPSLAGRAVPPTVASHPGTYDAASYAQPGAANSAAHAYSPPPVTASAAPQSGKIWRWALLAVALFMVGAGVTGATLWFVLGEGEHGSDSVVAAAGPETSPTPTAPSPEEPTAGVSPIGADVPSSSLVNDPTDPPSETRARPSPRERRRRTGAEPNGDGPSDRVEAVAVAPTEAESPPSEPESPEPSAQEPAESNPVAEPPPSRSPPEQRPEGPVRRGPRPSTPTGIPHSQVTRTLQARTPYIRGRCFLRRLARNPNLRDGVVTIAFTISASGRVQESRVVHNGTGDDWMARCTEQNLRATRFPTAIDGQPTRARYPFQFRR